MRRAAPAAPDVPERALCGPTATLYLEWRPLPRRPWGVYNDDCRLVKSFDTSEQAWAWMLKEAGQ